jgi:predicted negative regulator of RcsB-dependent stress response
MPNETLVAAVKGIVVLAKAGKSDEAYAAYAKLFAGAPFTSYSPSDQRQALKLMILGKKIPHFPPAPIVEAHRAAIEPLRALVAAHGEAADYEMLGLCQVRTGDEVAARASFQAGLDIERARQPQSPLCGTLMKHVASV